MGGVPLLRYFLLVQVCLVLFYALWRLSAWHAGAVSQRAGAGHWVTLGRVFLAASLASPLLCAGLESMPFTSRWLPGTPYAGRLLGEMDGPGEGGAPVESRTPIRVSNPAETTRGGFPALPALVWALGSMSVLFFRALQWRRLGRFLEGAVSLRRWGRLEILVHPGAVSPFATRRKKRAIVVIPNFLLGSGRWREALRHELVHHRRGDVRWGLAVDAMTVLLWANPVVWLWRRRLGELHELACDEQLLERGWVSPLAYGGALLDVAEAFNDRSTPFLGTCATLAVRARGGRSALSRRLDRILNYSLLRRFDMKRWIVWATAGLVLWVAVAAAWAAGGAAAGPAAPDLRLKADLQKLVSDKLAAHLKRFGARRGAAVVMDPVSGAVLARAGARLDETTRRIVTDDTVPFSLHFLGASTLKPLVVAGALQERVVNAPDVFDTEDGTLTLDGRTFHEWKDGGLGKVSVADILVKSSNLGVILVARRLGTERLAGFLDRLGYSVALDAPVEDLACGNYSGVSITAHQMAYAYTVLVNGGRDPRTGETIVRPEVSGFIRNALVKAVEEGTGTNARCRGIAVGGKTGTSIREVDGVRTGTAYFVGFAPAVNPRVVVSIVVDDAGKDVNGNRHAAALFPEIVQDGLPMLDRAEAKK